MAKLRLVARNVSWWKSGLSVGEKLSYYPSMAISVARDLATKEKRLNYLGESMEYDNTAAPLTMQLYPEEISNKILENTDGAIKSVLDIGGNIGQFSRTMSYFLPKADIHVIEPNPDVFELLTKNTETVGNIAIHNVGIGKPGKTTMHYTPGKSGTGSLFKDNAGGATTQEIEIELVNDVEKLTKTKSFDLVKIDVEGYEFQLLKEIKPFKTRYMFIEVSGLSRHKDYSHSEFYRLIEEKFGSFDIVHQTITYKTLNNFDVLLKFTDA